MPATALSTLLLSLHNAAAQAAYERCRETLLAALRRHIPFDSAIWGCGAEQPQMIFAIAVLDFPLDRLVEYAAWQSQDALRAAIGSRPGTALRNEDIGPLEDHYASAIYRGFCGPAGLAHTLGVTEVDPVTNVGELIFLFRSEQQGPFRDSERELLEEVMPHLVAAARHRQMWEFASRSQPPVSADALSASGHAIVDAQGHVHASDPAFGLAVRAAFPDWLGPLLPAPFVEGLRRGAAVVKAGSHCFQLLPGAGRHVVRLQSPGLIPLSPAEFRVARLFAQGLTAPAVAARLGVSPLTVRNHVTAIYARLEIHSKAELGRYMARLES